MPTALYRLLAADHHKRHPAEKNKLNGVQRMVKGYDLLVRTLEEMGVRTIYGLPGEENIDIMESIRNSKKIEFEGNRHE
ncbi:thiamine pyrophosphate-binding protein, partial [Rhizobium ruizarguesonis]